MPPLRVLITAPPATGKTTLCDKAAQRLQPPEPQAELLLEGFLCHERRAAGRRVGFDLVTLKGEKRAPLASMDGPETGKKVGNYHVQVDEFESLALPILERMESSKGKRLLIFDEIGKMELFSGRFVEVMSKLLQSPDPELHILGTVALKGTGLIEESKQYPGVEVMEISKVNRDESCDRVVERFASALGLEVQPPAAAVPEADATGDIVGPLPTDEDFTFAEAPPPGQFTPVFPKDPTSNLASMNAGDYFLYVGGNGINRAFAEAFKEIGSDPKGRYEVLHEALLNLASKTPGKLVWIRPCDLFPKPAAGVRKSKCSYCSKDAECWRGTQADWSSCSYCSECWDYWARWAFQDLSALCGLVPASTPGLGATDEQLAGLRPVGLAAVSVFKSRKRPRGSERNVAMLYTVGPNCGNTRKKGRRDVDKLSASAFTRVLQSVGHAVGSAVSGYNRERGRFEQAASDSLPRIDLLRVCLISGAVYRHPDVPKEQVATALLRGLVAAHVAAGPDAPRCDFAWDDDVFKIAWNKMLKSKPPEEKA